MRRFFSERTSGERGKEGRGKKGAYTAKDCCKISVVEYLRKSKKRATWCEVKRGEVSRIRGVGLIQ